MGKKVINIISLVWIFVIFILKKLGFMAPDDATLSILLMLSACYFSNTLLKD